MTMLTIHDHQDITALSWRVDAIVNAANPRLERGGGVCGAIFKAAEVNGDGCDLLADECRMVFANYVGEAESRENVGYGSALATGAYGLTGRTGWIIHAVGIPCESGGDYYETMKLRQAYAAALRVARTLGCKSIAFPLLGAGIYGWPYDKALEIAQDSLKNSDMNIHLCLYV